MADLDWNGDEILAALEEPFHQANEVLGRKFQNEITANKWSWPNPPSPRDIVDTGTLRGSYVGERVPDGRAPTHDHSWGAEYAMAVHEGAVFKDGSEFPERPWTEKPLEDGELEKAFERLAKRALGGIK